MQSTEWRPVPNFEDRYEVSEDGAVRTLTTGHIHKQFPDDYGHLRLGLWNGKKTVTVKAHRLVARAFLGEPGEGQEVCHNDGNPKNNNRGNLRWGTRAENVADRIKHGRTYRGTPRAIPEAEWPRIVERARRGERKTHIAKDYGVGQDAVRRIVKELAPEIIGVRVVCGNGHPWSDETTFMIRPGVRRCRQCEKVCDHKKYLRRKAKLAALQARTDRKVA